MNESDKFRRKAWHVLHDCAVAKALDALDDSPTDALRYATLAGITFDKIQIMNRNFKVKP